MNKRSRRRSKRKRMEEAGLNLLLEPHVWFVYVYAE